MHNNSDSDVFRSVKVPSRPMQNQNVNVTTTTSYCNKICILCIAQLAQNINYSKFLTRHRLYQSAQSFVLRLVSFAKRLHEYLL